MLVLTRRLGEDISIGDDIVVRIVSIKGKQVKIGIDAPKSLQVHRGEIYELIKEENKMAAGAKKDIINRIAARIGK
ncbi:MAG: carbon storage regulator CsrA [Candidatus Anammoxibacter sp.]